MTAAPDAAPRRGMAGADRKRLLLEAAATVFLRDGYGNAHMSDIARLAGMSKRTLYEAYPSKTALFEAVILDSMAPFVVDQEVERHPDLATALRALLEPLVAHLLAPRQIEIFRLIISEVKRAPELADAFEAGGPRCGGSSIERRLAAEMEAGRLDLPSAREGARMLFGMAIGASQMWLLLGLGEAPAPGEISRMARTTVEIFLRGALRPGHEDAPAPR